MNHRHQIVLASTVLVLVAASIALFREGTPTPTAPFELDEQSLMEVDSLPATDATRPPSPLNLNVSPYLAQTYGETVRKAELPGATIDALVAAGYANDICEQHSHSRPSDALSSGRPSAERASERFVREFSEQFCVGYPGVAERGDVVDALLARSGFDNEALVVSAAFEAVASGGSEDVDTLRTSMVEVAAETDSPFVFMTINELLASQPFRDDTAFPNTSLSDESMATAQRFSAMLATCSRFPICGQRSLLTVRSCMPFQCEPNGGVRGYVQRRLNKDEYHEAERMARKIAETQ